MGNTCRKKWTRLGGKRSRGCLPAPGLSCSSQSGDSGWHGTSQVALVVKNPPVNAGDISDGGSIPGLGRSPGGEQGNPLQYSCLGNPMDRGVWQGVAKSRGLQRARHDWSDLACTHTCPLALQPHFMQLQLPLTPPNQKHLGLWASKYPKNHHMDGSKESSLYGPPQVPES